MAKIRTGAKWCIQRRPPYLVPGIFAIMTYRPLEVHGDFLPVDDTARLPQ
jgi:hypothetical protein